MASTKNTLVLCQVLFCRSGRAKRNPTRVCKVFVTISATLEFFMLFIVVGILRVPSLFIVVGILRVPSLFIVVGILRVPSLQKKNSAKNFTHPFIIENLIYNLKCVIIT